MASSDILLNAVVVDTTGTGRQCKGPVTIFADGSFSGENVSIQTAPSLTDAAGVVTAGPYVEVLTFTAAGRQNLLQFGSYFVRAVLSSSSGAAITVRTS